MGVVIYTPHHSIKIYEYTFERRLMSKSHLCLEVPRADSAFTKWAADLVQFSPPSTLV